MPLSLSTAIMAWIRISSLWWQKDVPVCKMFLSFLKLEVLILKAYAKPCISTLRLAAPSGDQSTKFLGWLGGVCFFTCGCLVAVFTFSHCTGGQGDTCSQSSLSCRTWLLAADPEWMQQNVCRSPTLGSLLFGQLIESQELHLQASWL